MFTVKATYRNETRRFTFPKSVLFPTYKELHDQLYRVFPISHNYYLSRLIFSPDASKPGRILVGKEVHSVEDYDSCVAPLRRLWPNPLLRFAIFDETPHKVPSVALERLPIYSAPTIPLSETASQLPSPVVFRQGCMLPPNLQPSIAPSHPPVHLFTPCVLPPPPPSKTTTTPPPLIPLFPTSSKPCTPQECDSVEVAPCCPVAKGKEDVEVLLSSFKDDLERILCRTFGTGYADKQSASSVEESTSGVSGVDFVPPRTETSIGAGANTSRWCFVCKTSFTGVWYGCIKCPWHAVCPACFSKSHGAHTLSFGPVHVVQQRSTTCSTQVPAQIARESQPREINRPQGSACSGPGGEPTLAVHRGIICDNCDKTVVGVRHKCLDCPDYDLCTACMESGATERHNPFHEFCDIESPGRVYVHSAVGSDRDRSLGNRCVPVTAATDPLVCHSANCDLCDSAIVGERYKCIVCPDFDTCSSCFSITTEQHPNHGFVKVSKPEDLMMRDSITLRQIIHPAVCDSCQKTIRGARYKCMHPNCPDFDLCASCEALPIPVHPLNHPLLKLKTSDTVIPTVYRVGEAQIIDEPVSGESITVCSESRSPALLSQSPPATPMKLPELTPAVMPGRTSNLMMEGLAPCAEEFLSPLGSPGNNVPGIVPASATVAPPHLLVDVADPPESPRSVHAASDIYHELWPRVNQEMMHLNAMQDLGAGGPVVNATITDSVAYKSLIAGKLAPGTPSISSISEAGEHHGACPASSVLGANSIVDGYRTPSSISSYDKESHRNAPQLRADGQKETVITNSRQSWSLDSALVGDANVPDGQIFPPGAEFVKGWHMANNGNLPWPTTTEIRFVDGEMFAPECSSVLKAKVGIAHPGGDLDIWTGDLKAPDVPGRYVGYWQLNDGQGNFFGSRVWIDLTVVDHHSDQASEQSLAASLVVMPSAHVSNSVDASEELQDAPQPSLPSSETVTDEVEDPESDISSVSLVSVPTSDDEDVEWRDTRTHSEPLGYVVLYDGRSEE